MKKKEKKKNIVILLIFFIIITACNKKESDDIIVTNFEKHFVDEDLATKIAENAPLNNSKKTYAKGVSKRKIKNLKAFKNKKGNNVFYITNYEEGGFMVLSADKRTLPILAQSNTNIFSNEIDSLPPGVKGWLSEVSNTITKIQESTLTPSAKFESAWYSIEKNINQRKIIDPEPDCEPIVEEIVGPLLSTLWEQRDGFNASLHTIPCSGSDFQVYAGCVAIAMAQIMKYHEYPTSYSWASMPNTTATTATADLILDINGGINNAYSEYPTYSCIGTGVHNSKDIGVVLKNRFNYTSAIFANYNHSNVVNDLDNNRPVLLAGYEPPNVPGGHMWVCDGYKRVWYYQPDCTGYAYLYLHMNWGWGNNYGANGYFAFDDWSPLTNNFNFNKKMFYNIIP
ncbi:hypothetical protein GCM10011416_23760 [Polaribacter pacificus]|uniref:Spi protease inhibitor domain-containing protein n=1 Tax=Polaribacter pacificus TaxID=1775173 RepID=A0A917MFT1_9FLAO|nr:C10 family peptidase [Polaribacter pacificus]GGH03923.1 hypothetical protein GCM10011416_23760 [Polaribacter pacificus]